MIKLINDPMRDMKKDSNIMREQSKLKKISKNNDNWRMSNGKIVGHLMPKGE